jgi:hypothetical protein
MLLEGAEAMDEIFPAADLIAREAGGIRPGTTAAGV